MNPFDFNSFNSLNMDNLINDINLTKFVNKFQAINKAIENEFLLTLSEQQLNEYLKNFVTRYVKQILEMKITCHDDWFRLNCIFSVSGIYMHVTSDFKLVHIQADRFRQRLVFKQQKPTSIVEVYAESYPKKIAINKALQLFYKVCPHHDPMRLALNKFKWISIKDNVIYIDIGNWLRKNKKLMENLQKFQVNYAYVAPEQLVLKTNVNPRDWIQINRIDDLITEKDNPHRDVA